MKSSRKEFNGDYEAADALLARQTLKVHENSENRIVLQFVDKQTGKMNEITDYHNDYTPEEPDEWDLPGHYGTMFYANHSRVFRDFRWENTIRGYDSVHSEDDDDPINQQKRFLVAVNEKKPSALVTMAHYAFSYHKPVKLRAEDVHLLVMQGFARFVMQYPQDFRASLVNFTEKRTLTVSMFDLSDIEIWEKLPRGFAQLVRQSIDNKDLADIILQDYSHTTETDRVNKAITLLAACSPFFEYEAQSFCHIPEFILEGTLEDWKKIVMLTSQLTSALQLQANADGQPALGTHLLHRWLTRLQENMLSKLYEARCGQTDDLFWSSFYKQYESSGHDTAITGNIIYFYPFLCERPNNNYNKVPGEIKLNHWIMDEAGVKLGTTYNSGPTNIELLSNTVEVDFKLTVLEAPAPVSYPAMMTSGFVGVVKDPADGAVKMLPEFSMFYKQNNHPPLPQRKKRVVEEVAPAAAENPAQQQPAAAPQAQEVDRKRIMFSF